MAADVAVEITISLVAEATALAFGSSFYYFSATIVAEQASSTTMVVVADVATTVTFGSF